MKKAIFAGTFDPFTVGHYDLVKRSADVFDEIIIAVAGNGSGKKCVATVEQRAQIVTLSVSDIPNVTVKVFDGLLTDFAVLNNVKHLIRGIRNVTDFEYEKNLMTAYQSINPDIEIFYLISQPSLSFVSSSFVREVKSFNGDVKKYLCPSVFEIVEKIY